MGLFDFVSDVGKKIFGSSAEASEKIKDYMEAENPGIKDLGVNFQDGVVTLSGVAESTEAMQKAVQMAGNIQGVSKVKVDNLTTPGGAEKERSAPPQSFLKWRVREDRCRQRSELLQTASLDQKQRPPCAPSKALMALTLTGLSDQKPGGRWIAFRYLESR